VRTIPTRVGSTSLDQHPPMPTADHPHAGGEHRFKLVGAHVPFGPSPRGWGALASVKLDPADSRTIPTRVGSTSSRNSISTRIPDHPHAGGEHEIGVPTILGLPGPSPRGWGARRRCLVVCDGPRTIPTRVGSTERRRCGQWLTTDHPHAGGEHVFFSCFSLARIGPSPRGWGALVPKQFVRESERTIPTRVGSTRAVPESAR